MNMQEFEVRTEQASEGAVTIRVIGELDLSTQERLREPLLQAAEANNSVVVDLSECEFIDSSGIRALLVGREAISGNGGGHLVVAGPQPQVQRVLEMTGLGEAIPVHESVEKALESFG
jgi:anti-sigma B factor antagonist